MALRQRQFFTNQWIHAGGRAPWPAIAPRSNLAWSQAAGAPEDCSASREMMRALAVGFTSSARCRECGRHGAVPSVCRDSGRRSGRGGVPPAHANWASVVARVLNAKPTSRRFWPPSPRRSPVRPGARGDQHRAVGGRELPRLQKGARLSWVEDEPDRLALDAGPPPRHSWWSPIRTSGLDGARGRERGPDPPRGSPAARDVVLPPGRHRGDHDLRAGRVAPLGAFLIALRWRRALWIALALAAAARGASVARGGVAGGCRAPRLVPRPPAPPASRCRSPVSRRGDRRWCPPAHPSPLA